MGASQDIVIRCSVWHDGCLLYPVIGVVQNRRLPYAHEFDSSPISEPMGGQISSIRGRAAMRVKIPLLLLAGPVIIWAVWLAAIGRAFGPTLLFYADGASTPMAAFHGSTYELREERPLSAYPSLLVDAVLLMEDRRFYEHHGVDVRAVLRATWVNARHGIIAQGGSTLTQQLARLRYLNHERTFWRKIKEAALAFSLETTLSKREILEQYLNEVYLGQRGTYEVRGIAAASRYYLGKEPGALRPGEVALLVGLIRSPNT